MEVCVLEWFLGVAGVVLAASLADVVKVECLGIKKPNQGVRKVRVRLLGRFNRKLEVRVCSFHQNLALELVGAGEMLSSNSRCSMAHLRWLLRGNGEESEGIKRGFMVLVIKIALERI